MRPLSHDPLKCITITILIRALSYGLNKSGQSLKHNQDRGGISTTTTRQRDKSSPSSASLKGAYVVGPELGSTYPLLMAS